jgi:hypothetical protein
MAVMEMNIKKLEAQLEQWGAKLDELEAKAKAAASDVKANAKSDQLKRIADLKLQYHAAQKKLSEFRAAGNEKWANFKDDMETLWKDIELTFKKLTH